MAFRRPSVCLWKVTGGSWVWPPMVKGEWAGTLVLVGEKAEAKGKML